MAEDRRMTAGERQVRNSLEAQRPTFDAATQALWDAWFAREFQKHFAPYVEKINKVTAANVEAHNKLLKLNERAAEAVKKLADENTKLRGEVGQLRKDLTASKGLHAARANPPPLPEFLRKAGRNVS